MRVMSPETEQVLDELVALAHGNVDLVREALSRGGAEVRLSEVVEFINRGLRHESASSAEIHTPRTIP